MGARAPSTGAAIIFAFRPISHDPIHFGGHPSDQLQSLDPDARALVAQGATLLDVRSPEEFGGGHIDGAINIPIQELSGRTDELDDKNHEIVVYCQSGARSAMAKRLLDRDGFTSVHDLGGLAQW